MRDAKGQFLKGTVANPGGRLKGLGEVRALARQHTAEAIEGLLFWARKRANKTARASVAACTELLNRGWGRTIEQRDGLEGGPGVQITIEQRIIPAASVGAVVDAEPEPPATASPPTSRGLPSPRIDPWMLEDAKKAKKH